MKIFQKRQERKRQERQKQVGDVLAESVHVLDRHGWTRGIDVHFYNGQVCARGAIRIAAGFLDENGVQLASYKSKWLADAAEKAAASLTPFHNLFIWNDGLPNGALGQLRVYALLSKAAEGVRSGEIPVY